ncbi:MAG: hypothetical protein ACYTAN_15815 [Planctomycetota bacterium]
MDRFDAMELRTGFQRNRLLTGAIILADLIDAGWLDAVVRGHEQLMRDAFGHLPPPPSPEELRAAIEAAARHAAGVVPGVQDRITKRGRREQGSG